MNTVTNRTRIEKDGDDLILPLTPETVDILKLVEGDEVEIISFDKSRNKLRLSKVENPLLNLKNP